MASLHHWWLKVFRRKSIAFLAAVVGDDRSLKGRDGAYFLRHFSTACVQYSRAQMNS
jgi:hypothetical protein